MKQLYHVLILEDNPSDEGLMTNELKKAGVTFTFTRVETRDDFLRELAERTPELILSDYTLPSFDGMAALSIVREGFDEIPFIFVTGTLGEEKAIEALKNGAADYVLKNKLSKLSPAVIRALQGVEERSARVKAETAQRESERRYRLMIESAGLGIGYYDLDGSLLYFNKISLGYMNGMLGDFIGQSVYDMYDKDLADLIMGRIREASCSDEVRIFEDFVAIPAGQRWFNSHYSRVLDVDGNVIGVQIISDDTTERKRMEGEIYSSEARYRRLFESAKDGILILDADTGVVTDVNPFLSGLLKKTSEQILGRKIWDLGFIKDIIANKANFEELRLKEYIRYEDKPLKTAEGGQIDVEFVSNVYEVNGHKVIQCNIRDISERKRMEDALRESEYEFRMLAESMPQIVWVCLPDGGNIYFNQQWVDYTGLTLEESHGDGWNKPFHPEDKQRAWDAWQNATKNLAEYSIKCRLRRADGIYTWWLVRGIPQLDAEGNVLKWFGTCTDIEILMQAEEELQHKLNELQRWHAVTLDREDRMLELKKEVNDLLKEAGRPGKYCD